MSTTTSHLLSGMEKTVGPALVNKIQSSKILLVGAGGIGSELLKNLALCGFRDVTTIDLDTIDVSNLNRQLLFRSQHVGHPKCSVACEVATAMVEDPTVVSFTPRHGNVCDNSFFQVQFVQQFDVVLNALDNVTARRRVNRICLAAGVPLVEAGTTGYLGQVNVIDKDSQVACYECKTQEVQKVYPICTIRSTPSMPVHTIVWAKEFYKLLFGEKVEESMLYEDPSGEEPSTYMEAVLAFRTILQEASGDKKEAAKNLIHKFYLDEIQKQLDMDRYKTAQKTPVPLDAALIDTAVHQPAPSSKSEYKQTDIPTKADCIAEFVACLEEARAGQVLPSFDKDDSLSMRFVMATSDLRSYVFGIEPIQSFYSAKGIAGNIIPAIATTNAIAAGLQVLQTFHILRQQLASGSKTGGLAESCKYINIIREKTRNGQYLAAASLDPPNPKCYVCRKNTLLLSINTNNWTFQEFLDKVIKKDLGFAEPSVMIEGNYVWEEGEGADVETFAANAVTTLSSMPYGGIKDGTTILIDDFSQELEVEIAVAHIEVWEKEDDEAVEEDDKYKFRFGGDKPLAVASKTDTSKVSAAAAKPSDQGDEDDDVVVEIVNEVIDDGDANSEKKRAANGNAGPPAKKSKVVFADGDDDVIELDD